MAQIFIKFFDPSVHKRTRSISRTCRDVATEKKGESSPLQHCEKLLNQQNYNYAQINNLPYIRKNGDIFRFLTEPK